MAEPRSDSFDAFYREQAPAVFDLALRHGGDHTIAVDCVDAVFAELAARWRRVSDPVRFSRRAAVLFVCGSRHRSTRAHMRCRPLFRSMMSRRQGRQSVDQHLPHP